MVHVDAVKHMVRAICTYRVENEIGRRFGLDLKKKRHCSKGLNEMQKRRARTKATSNDPKKKKKKTHHGVLVC